MHFRFILFFAIFLLSVQAFAQIKVLSSNETATSFSCTFIPDEDDFSVSTDSKYKTILYPGYFDPTDPGKPALPSKTVLIAIPPYSKVSVKLENIIENRLEKTIPAATPKVEFDLNEALVYKKTDFDNKYFTTDIYPTQKIETVGYKWIRNYYCAVVRINTHQFNWKTKEIIEIRKADLNIFFSLNPNRKPVTFQESTFDEEIKSLFLNPDQATQFRTLRETPIDTTGNWIDYNTNYIKLALDKDGIYQITYNDLISYGISPASIDPKKLKLFWKGKEQAIYVSGENDGEFNQADIIRFWGTKNYGDDNYRDVPEWRETYPNYMDRYNDTSFVWLCWNDGDGKRMQVKNGTPDGTAQTITNYRTLYHVEEDNRLVYYDSESPYSQLPFWQHHKVWTWTSVSNNSENSDRDTTILFSVDSPIADSSVSIYVRLISRASYFRDDAHRLAIGINGSQLLDSITYDAKEIVTFASSQSGSLLQDGENTLLLDYRDTDLSVNQSLLDWVEVSYRRTIRAMNDSLRFSFKSDNLTGIKNIAISGISGTDLLLYKVSPTPAIISNYSITGSGEKTITFSDIMTNNDEYFLISSNNLLKPRFVDSYNFPNLRNAQRKAEYIIITTKRFADASAEYESFIQSEYGVETELVFVEDIYNEFSYGLDNVASIRDFLYNAYTKWQEPKPSYLLLMGDASYDYKKNMFIGSGKNRQENFMPAYGNPVSDAWFTAWNDTLAGIPEMYVGRIPAKSNEQIRYYLEKHRTYINRPYDVWNKTAIFFSSGDSKIPSQLEQIRSVQSDVFENMHKAAPFGGTGVHFYKTAQPFSNIGPYSLDFYDSTIAEGSLYMSYIGHSGTSSWDNGIIEPLQLNNQYPDRFPLSTDFGCSTGKFAEPDFSAFGEEFVTSIDTGQAIGYCGNASWGYTSSAYIYPKIFYRMLLQEGESNLGALHTLAKIEQFLMNPSSETFLVFNYTNILFGDPIIDLKTPKKPNFTIKSDDFSLLEENPTELLDSVTVRIIPKNLGISTDTTQLKIIIGVSHLGNSILADTISISAPLYADTLYKKIPVKNRVGDLTISVTLDPQNSIDEIYENDNTAQYIFTIYSVSARPFTQNNPYILQNNLLKVLNPSELIFGLPERIKVEIDTSESFVNPFIFTENFDTVITAIETSQLTEGQRYFWRSKIDFDNIFWSSPSAFTFSTSPYKWRITAPFTDDLEYEYIDYYEDESVWKIGPKDTEIRFLSIGGSGDPAASITVDRIEQLEKTYFWGIVVSELNDSTLIPEKSHYFIYQNDQSRVVHGDSLTKLIESYPEGKKVSFLVCADAVQSVLDWSKNRPVRKAIKTMGSYYIDSVEYNDSWAMIGVKGAEIGSVPEMWSPYESTVLEIDTTVQTIADTGFVKFPPIGKGSVFNKILLEQKIPLGSSIDYTLFASNDTKTDTFSVISQNNEINPEIIGDTYHTVQLGARMILGENETSPEISSVTADFTEPAELAINYQVVHLEKDTLEAGEEAHLNFAVYNVGETNAEDVTVKLSLKHPNNTLEVINTWENIDIQAEMKSEFSYALNTIPYQGSLEFVISIDPENEIMELFEDNNRFAVPFFINADLTNPSLTVTFDGEYIIDGQYITPTPEIEILLYDESFMPITDTSSVQLYLNDEPLYYFSDEIHYTMNDANPKMSVTYTPELETGEYVLRVEAKDASGNPADSTGLEKRFKVETEAKLMEVYNYPNPFPYHTYFTCILTQIPDELTIRIFTVAGRLIREIRKTSAELNYDFNTIFWDGRDQDGDVVANGVYLYKVIMKSNGKTETVAQKLAKVK